MSTGLLRNPRIQKVMAWIARDWRGPRCLAWGAAEFYQIAELVHDP